MLLHKTYREPKGPAILDDVLTAARAGSFISLLASLWFFLTPYAYFGVSEVPVAWNFWLVGAPMVLLALLRIFWPVRSTVASYINVAFGVWAILSPFVFGYTYDFAWTMNSISCGAVTIAASLFSATFTRRLHGVDLPRWLPTDEMIAERDERFEVRTGH